MRARAEHGAELLERDLGDEEVSVVSRQIQPSSIRRLILRRTVSRGRPVAAAIE